MSSVDGSNPNIIRAMVTDDTSLYRRTLADILSNMQGVEVVATAFDGEDCLVQASKLMPDFVTMDMQMPRRDGLSTLDEIKRRKLPIHVVMVCSETLESAEQTVQALRMGALDMILKPSSNNLAENRKSLELQLANQVQTVRLLKERKNSIANGEVIPRRNRESLGTFSRDSKQDSSSFVSPSATQHRVLSSALSDVITTPRVRTSNSPKCICIGVSTGGPQALGTLIQDFPEGLPFPVFVVQHMPPLFTKSLADHLNRSGKIRVSEAVHGEMAIDGHIYIAPGGKQMRVEKKPSGFQIQVTDDAPIGACKPSVDYLFESVHQCVGGDAIAIILTGMGADGLAGCRRLHTSGARIMAQNAETCVVYGMPRQIVDNNLAHDILPLDEISSRIAQLVPRKLMLCN